MVARVVVRDVFETNAYFAIDEATGSGFLIDPGAEAARLYGIVRDRGWCIERILLTHGHFDHTAAAEALSRAWNAPISRRAVSCGRRSEPQCALRPACHHRRECRLA